MTKRLLFAALLVLTAGSALARNEEAPPARIYQTARIQGEAPTLDGKIDDPVWSQVEFSGDFVQRQPEDGVPPTAQTEFKIVYDDEALYFAFRMHDDPDLVRSVLARRDWFPGDWIEVNIDSYHDLRTAFSFTLSLSGTRGDEFVSNDGNNWDGNWDPVWQGATSIDTDGWTAEMKIPLSQLRFDSADKQVWGLQVQRRIYREEERSSWQEIPRDISGWVSNFGEIHGIDGIRPVRRIEILPYMVARGERFEPEEDNPFRDGSSSDLDAGIDGKIGLTRDWQRQHWRRSEPDSWVRSEATRPSKSSTSCRRTSGARAALRPWRHSPPSHGPRVECLLSGMRRRAWGRPWWRRFSRAPANGKHSWHSSRAWTQSGPRWWDPGGAGRLRGERAWSPSWQIGGRADMQDPSPPSWRQRSWNGARCCWRTAWEPRDDSSPLQAPWPEDP